MQQLGVCGAANACPLAQRVVMPCMLGCSSRLIVLLQPRRVTPVIQIRSGGEPSGRAPSSARSRASTFSLKPACSQAVAKPACACSGGQGQVPGAFACEPPARTGRQVALPTTAPCRAVCEEYMPESAGEAAGATQLPPQHPGLSICSTSRSDGGQHWPGGAGHRKSCPFWEEQRAPAESGLQKWHAP